MNHEMARTVNFPFVLGKLQRLAPDDRGPRMAQLAPEYIGRNGKHPEAVLFRGEQYDFFGALPDRVVYRLVRPGGAEWKIEFWWDQNRLDIQPRP